MSQAGVEPATHRLKVYCSTTELLAHIYYFLSFNIYILSYFLEKINEITEDEGFEPSRLLPDLTR